MARGWESKSVEEQQSQAISNSDNPRPRLTHEQISIQRKREGLLLSRKRVLQQLQNSQNPQLRSMLEEALSALDLQLSQPE
jgi:hypothetical protein